MAKATHKGLRALGSTLTLATLAVYTRMKETLGEYDVRAVEREAEYLKVDYRTVLTLFQLVESAGGFLDYSHVSMASTLKLRNVEKVSDLDYLARLTILGSRRPRLYDKEGNNATTADLKRLARRLLRALDGQKIDAYNWRQLCNALDGRDYASVWATVSSFRRYPATMQMLLTSGFDLSYQRTLLVKRCFKLARLRLKFEVDSDNMARFLRFILDRICYYSHNNAMDLIHGWKVYNGTGTEEKTRGDSHNRRADRRAQRDREANALKHKHAFQKGSKLADVAKHVCDSLAEEARASSSPVVVYGRDCEVFYHILKEFYPDVVASYVLAPRPLTTENYSENKKVTEYHAYLRRQIPANAIHFDSGFAGTIIKWVRNKLNIPLKSIRLISTEYNDMDLLGAASRSPRMRQIVLDDIEHEAHRLVESRGGCWRAWEFSDDVERFWARLEGMRQGMLAFANGSRTLLSLKDICGVDRDDVNEVPPASDGCSCSDCQGVNPDDSDDDSEPDYTEEPEEMPEPEEVETPTID